MVSHVTFGQIDAQSHLSTSFYPRDLTPLSFCNQKWVINSHSFAVRVESKEGRTGVVFNGGEHPDFLNMGARLNRHMCATIGSNTFLAL